MIYKKKSKGVERIMLLFAKYVDTCFRWRCAMKGLFVSIGVSFLVLVGVNCGGDGESCTPNCSGRECGWDPVCGTMDCGSCQDGETCNSEGQCVDSCTPNCAGRECGWDPICGTMNCGDCEEDETCNEDGQCVSDCTPSCTGRECGPDGCGRPK